MTSRELTQGGVGEAGLYTSLQQGAGNLNIKRLLLIQKTQISPVKRFGDVLCMGRGKCLALQKPFFSYLRGANPAFFIAHNLIPGLPSETAGVVDGCPSQPPSSLADVADGLMLVALFHLDSGIFIWKRLVYG